MISLSRMENKPNKPNKQNKAKMLRKKIKIKRLIS